MKWDHRVENVSLMGSIGSDEMGLSGRKCEFKGSIGSDGMGLIG